MTTTDVLNIIRPCTCVNEIMQMLRDQGWEVHEEDDPKDEAYYYRAEKGDDYLLIDFNPFSGRIWINLNDGAEDICSNAQYMNWRIQ